MIDTDRLRERLSGMNIIGWHVESEHGCDGSEEDCARRCPVAVQIEYSPDEIITAILDLDVPMNVAGAYTPATPAHPSTMIEGGHRD